MHPHSFCLCCTFIESVFHKAEYLPDKVLPRNLWGLLNWTAVILPLQNSINDLTELTVGRPMGVEPSLHFDSLLPYFYAVVSLYL